jgi:tetratricopeptide (TPR) repeat protein
MIITTYNTINKLILFFNLSMTSPINNSNLKFGLTEPSYHSLSRESALVESNLHFLVQTVAKAETNPGKKTKKRSVEQLHQEEPHQAAKRGKIHGAQKTSAHPLKDITDSAPQNKDEVSAPSPLTGAQDRIFLPVTTPSALPTRKSKRKIEQLADQTSQLFQLAVVQPRAPQKDTQFTEGASLAGRAAPKKTAKKSRSTILTDNSPVAAIVLATRSQIQYPELLREGRKALDKVLSLDENNLSALVSRASIYNLESKYNSAIADLNKALTLRPDDSIRSTIYAELSTAYLVGGKPDLALSSIKQALSLAPHCRKALLNRAELFRGNARMKSLGFPEPLLDETLNLETVLKDLEFLIATDKLSLRPYTIRAGIFYLIGNLSDSRKDIDKALEINPNYAYALRASVRVHLKCGNLDAALIDYKHFLENNTTQLSSVDELAGICHKLLSRAKSYREEGNLDQAFNDLNQILALDEKCVPALYARAEVWRLQGNFEQAIEDLTKSIRLDPGDYLGLELRAHIYIDLGRWDLAIGDLENAIRNAPPSILSRIYEGLWESYSQAKKHERALGSLKEYLKKGEPSPDIYDRLSNTYLSIGQPERALESIKKSYELAPEGFTPILQEGLAHGMRGDLEQAKRCFEKALKIKWDSIHALRWLAKIDGLQKQVDLKLEDLKGALLTLHNSGFTYFLHNVFEQPVLIDDREGQALNDLNLIIAANPENPSALYFRSDLYFQKKDLSNALLDIEKAIYLLDQRDRSEIQRMKPVFLSLRAEVNLEIGEIEKAFGDINKALELNDVCCAALSVRHQALKKQREFDGAIKCLQRILEIHPNNEKVLPFIHTKGRI